MNITCRAASEFGRPPAAASIETPQQVPRDLRQRAHYARAALAHLPRLLAAVDRHPWRPTYGCFDRQFWHYRTADFPSEMYQEAVLPLAWAYCLQMPGNPWYAQPRVRRLALAGIHFAARACHADGACDDYYPQERALGAAAFSLVAGTRAYQLLQESDDALVRYFRLRGRWLATHDETGRLANHQALAALGLWRVFEISGDSHFAAAAEARWKKLLSWQSPEGWFEEYGGADPGYHTVTLSCLAELRRLTRRAELDEPIARALDFAAYFLHPDDSYSGDYGSRGTYHCYPHGFELLAGEFPAAARLADACLRSLARGTEARFDDDRLVAHRVASLLSAYADWSPLGAADDAEAMPATRWFADAGLLVHRGGRCHTVISAARGGVFKHFSHERATTDTGLVAELAGGNLATSQVHDRGRAIEFHQAAVDDSQLSPRQARWQLRVRSQLCRAPHDTLTPFKLIVFRLALLLGGRWFRGPIRSLLQRRLITARSRVPIELLRTFECCAAEGEGTEMSLRVTDRVTLLRGAPRIARLAFSSDLQSAYVAASQVYQASVLEDWTDLSEHLPALARDGHVVIVREFGPGEAHGIATHAVDARDDDNHERRGG